MNMPKLRFPLQDNKWREEPIISLADYVDYRGKTPKKTESGVFLVTAKNIKQGYIDYESSQEFIDPGEYDEVMRRGKPQIDDVLITTEAPLGNIASVDREDIALAQRVIKYRGKDKLMNSCFLKQLFLAPRFQDEIASKATGGTVQGIKGSVLHQIKIYIPDFDEQTMIADFLSSVDKKITLLNKQYDLLRQYKKGMMQKIFSQEVRFKDENGKDFPQWRLKKIREITSLIKDGTHGTHNNVTESDFLLLSAKNIQEGKVVVDSKDRKISEIEFRAIIKNYKLAPGDILLSVVGTIGRVAIYSEKYANYAFQRSVAFFRFPQEQPEFIYQLFNSTKFQKELIIRQVISAQPGIYLGDLADISLEIPVQKEQMKIANFLSALDDEIAAKKAELDKLKTWKQGLSQQMFV